MTPIPSLVMTGSILTPLYQGFGWLMLQLYDFLNNYGLVIILFTVILRLILLPLNVKQHKTMLKQQALSKDQAELARIYGDDRAGLQQAQAELYKKHGISQTGGCLLSLLQLFLIWPIYRIISAPLKYIMGMGDEALNAVGKLLQDHQLITEAQAKGATTLNIPLINALNHNPGVYAEAVNQNLIASGDLMDLKFLGLNLGLQPTWKPGELFGPHMSTLLPLLLIPLIAVVTSFLTSKIQEWTNPMYWRIREEKELAKNNPARSVSTDATMVGMNKTMKWMMPIFTLLTVFSMPAAMGLYWIIGNCMMIVQQLLFYNLYTKPAFASIRPAKDKTAAAPELATATAGAQTMLDGKVVSEKKNTAHRSAPRGNSSNKKKRKR